MHTRRHSIELPISLGGAVSGRPRCLHARRTALIGLPAMVILALAIVAVTPACVAGEAESSFPRLEKDSMVVQQLREKARSKGLVRVIVSVGVDAEKNATSKRATTGEETARAQRNLADFMAKSGAALVKPLSGTPLIVMELSAAALDTLVASGMATAIQEDTPDKPFN